MIQPSFSSLSYSCIHFLLWSNCVSKDMPLTKLSQSNMTWTVLPCFLCLSTSSITYPVGPPVGLSSILRCSSFCSSEELTSLSSDYRIFAELMLLEPRRPSAGTDVRGSRQSTASQPGLQKEKLKEDLSMCMFVPTTLGSTPIVSEEPVYSENSSTTYIAITFLIHRGLEPQVKPNLQLSARKGRATLQIQLANKRRSNFPKERNSLFSISQFQVV